MNLIIGLILLVSSVSLAKATTQQYVNVINADKNPPDKICGGVLVSAEWALSSKTCVESLFKVSQNVRITAGHSENKPAEQIIKVTMVPVGNKEVKGESIVALRLEKPITKNSLISWAKLPPIGYLLCKDPKSVAFQAKSSNTAARQGFVAMMTGIVIVDLTSPCCPTCPRKCHDGQGAAEDDGMRQLDPTSKMGTATLDIIKVKSKKDACQPESGWPLMCDGDMLVGIEINCKKVEGNEVESEYLNVFKSAKDISRIVYHKEMKEPMKEPSNHTEDIVPPSPDDVRQEEKSVTGATSEATVHARVWKQLVLTTLITLLFYSRMH